VDAATFLSELQSIVTAAVNTAIAPLLPKTS
jgi:hypothetical protein